MMNRKHPGDILFFIRVKIVFLTFLFLNSAPRLKNK